MMMDANNMYYNQQPQPTVIGNPAQQPYTMYDPTYGYVPVGFNNIPVPTYQNSLTGEEIQILKNDRPSTNIDLSIDRNDVLRSICNHKDNGRDVVMRVNDGSNDVYCPICRARWNPDIKTKEEVQELVEDLVNQMQVAKWIGDYPNEVAREYFPMIPMLKKYPELHEYAVRQYDKLANAVAVHPAQDASVYNMFNALTSPQMYGYYNQQPAPQPPMGYYGQPAAPQPQPGYAPANAAVNPMQVPYGVSPAAPNQQYNQQANMMMGGSIYGGMPMGGYPGMMNPAAAPAQAPTPAAPAQPQGQAPVTAPAPAAPGPAVTTNVAPQGDGTVKSENKIDL